ncbi:UDP-N-acetylmuramoyl-L-alanine--D-glutamate ligase [Brevundimonas sp. 2R-24]|uniref:UDP-N-acetylmuramoylalanine--D-glutamate ligase n=1 Tax=Peiella sedimenti TaxID=3061083 RepID=A0ABT8SMN1_9CAUL|nr:UDP-N-acetylmuramoyl-L-alanine--D-glutamate ligase [Caulobacteraceae bacterium XZ-24]
MIPVRGFEGRTVAVFGAGRSGLSAAEALRAGGAAVIIWDDNGPGRERAAAEGFAVEDLSARDWSDIAALMLSPGAPLTHPKPHWTVAKARAADAEILGDIELLHRTLEMIPAADRPKVVAITGTNGKSTTTALIGWMLKHAGRAAQVGGNIGVGALALEPPQSAGTYVLECSSYQLDLTHRFAPDVAVWMNISPDHLDRHGGMDGYVAAKRRIFANQGAGQTAVVGVDDAWGQATCTELMTRKAQRVVPISATRVTPGGVYALDGVLYDATNGATRKVADLSQARSLPGRHNGQNAAAAYAAVRALGLSVDEAVEGLLTFPGLAHRMEEVGRLAKADGGMIRFINDSKATNADAARQALSSYGRVWWIAGGRAKDGGIADLADLFPRVAKAYLIGEAAEDFARTIGHAAPWTVVREMVAAVAAAAKDAAAQPGEQVVLLSPACASFDQYPDFEARGEAFRAAVQALEPQAQVGAA